MNPWKGLKGLPSPIWVLSLSTLVNRMGTMAVFFLTLYLVQGRGWRPEQAASAMFAYGLGALAAAPISGHLSDRIGHRRLLLGSLVLSGLLVLLVPFAMHPWQLLPLLALWSAITQAFWPSSMALITELSTPENRKQAFVLHRLAANLGLSVGPALGGWIANHSFSAIFWIDGLTTLAGAVVLALGVKETVASVHDGPPSHSAWKDRRLLYLLLAGLPATLVFVQLTGGSLSLWISRDLAYGPGIYGLMFTFNTLLILLIEVALNQGLAHWRHGAQLAAGGLFIALGFGLTGLAGMKSMFVLTTILWTFGEMILLPAQSDAVAALAPADRRGEYMGMYSLAWTVALTLGPWLGLLVYAKAGPQLLWMGCGGVSALSAGLLLRVKVPKAE